MRLEGPPMNANSWISPSLVKTSLKRFWPLWALYLLSWLMLFILPAYSMATSAASFIDDPLELAESTERIWTIARSAMLPFIAVWTVVIAVSLNDHLFDARAATFTGSLPLRRRAVFASAYVAGILAQAAIILLTCAVLLGIRVALPTVGLSLVAQWAALALALTFVFYSLAVLACQLTGTRPVALVLYILANVLVICIETALNLIVSAFQYGMRSLDSTFDWASPLFGIAHYGLYSSEIGSGGIDWTVIALYCAAAVAFTALACLLHSRRSFENAGEAVAWNVLRPLLKYLAGISAALLFAAFTILMFWTESSWGAPVSFSRAVALIALMAAGAILGVVFAEMVMAHSTHVLKRCWKGSVVLACLAIAVGCGMYFDLFGITRHIPEVYEVDAVEVRVYGDLAAELSSDEGIEQARQLQADILEYGSSSKGYSQVDIDIRYRLLNGGEVHRTYNVNYNGDLLAEGEAAQVGGGNTVIDELGVLSNSLEGRESRFKNIAGDGSADRTVQIESFSYEDDEAHSTITLPAAQVDDFLQNALKPDMLEHEAGVLWMFTESISEINASVSINAGDDEYVASLWLSESGTPNSLAWIREHYPTLKLEPLEETEELEEVKPLVQEAP